MKYFSYDPNGDGFQTHETSEEAKKVAEDALENEREEAIEEWNEEVTEICWGEIKQHIAETNRRPINDQDPCRFNCAEYVEYELVEI